MQRHTSDNKKSLRLAELPRASCRDPGDFLKRFVPGRRPIILTDLVTRWPAYGRWTPEHFKERFPNARCKVAVDIPSDGIPYEDRADDHLRDMTLPQFVDHMRSSSKPCYYRRQHADKLPGLEADVDFEQLTPGFKANTDFVWIGSAGTRTRLHFDAQDNILCQIYGTKELWLVDPGQSKFLRPYADSVTKSRATPDQPDFERLPDLDRVTFFHGTLEAGEAIFIPNHWWHSVVSRSVSISFNHEFGAKTSWLGFASAVNAGGVRSWLAVGRDFVRYGLIGRPYRRRLADDPPFGRVVFDMLAGSIRRVFR